MTARKILTQRAPAQADASPIGLAGQDSHYEPERYDPSGGPDFLCTAPGLWLRCLCEQSSGRLVFRRRYGPLGFVHTPFFILGEMLAPVVELVGYVFTIIGIAIGAISTVPERTRPGLLRPAVDTAKPKLSFAIDGLPEPTKVAPLEPPELGQPAFTALGAPGQGQEPGTEPSQLGAPETPTAKGEE